MKLVAIIQSNYIPWKGYMDILRAADEFILYDDVQYTRRDWRNRNRIKTAGGTAWLTIPVETGGQFQQAVKDVRVADNDWARVHWETISRAYARAPHFKTQRDRFEALYRSMTATHLSQINRLFLEALCDALNIPKNIRWSSDYELTGDKTERLVNLCRQAGATDYLSGPSARDYIDPALFEQAGIRLRWADYAGYPEYPQIHPPFEHQVSTLDLLFHCGPDSLRYMKDMRG